MEIFMPGELDRKSEEKSYLRGCGCEEEILNYEEETHSCGEDCKCSCEKRTIDICCEKKFKMALKIIKSSIADEKTDEIFYDYLIKYADTDEERCIIKSIRDDEAKHNMLLKRVYCDFTGKDVVTDDCIEFEKPKSYIHGVKQALCGELKAFEKYRKVLEAMPNQYYRDIICEVMTDEMKHATWYNYILFLNLEKKCM